MAFIDHIDHIWTVDQFNTFCKENNIDASLTPAQDPLGEHNRGMSTRRESYTFTEGGREHATNLASEAYAVIFAVDRLKDIGNYTKFTGTWQD